MTKEYPKFDINQLIGYNGANPFIKKIRRNMINSADTTITGFENEYLIKNFLFQGYKFDKIKVEVGEKTKKSIQQQYNTDKEINNVYFDMIIGETDEKYHVSSPSPNGRMDMWLYKEEVGDLYQKIFTRNSIDFYKLNSLFQYSLFDHQEIGVHFLTYNPKSFLFDTVGNGKTHQAIAAALHADCQKVLIVCLSGKKIDWRRELSKWGQSSKIINGKNNWIEEPSRFTIINFEILADYHEPKTKGKKIDELFRPLVGEFFDCIIVDEIQKIKNPNAKRSKAIEEIASCESVKYVWGLSATPIEKNIDYFNICRNLSMSIGDVIYCPKDYPFYTQWYGKYEEFLARYCHGFKIVPKKKIRPFWVLGKKINGVKVENDNTYELHQRIKHLQLRRRTEDSIEGFPIKTRSPLYYDLSAKEQQEYNELFENYVQSKLIMKSIDSILAAGFKELKKISNTNKFESIFLTYVSSINDQINLAGSFNDGHEKIIVNYGENAKNRLEKAVNDSGKIAKSSDFDVNESRELIETILLRQYLAIKKVPHTVSFVKSEIQDGKNSIIFTHFKEEFELLVKKLGKCAVTVQSGWTAAKKQEAIDEFMNNPEKTVIIGNIITLGTGYNITKADNVVTNSPNWNGGEHIQGEGRAWRIGRKDPVSCWYPLFDGTIEEKVFERAESKKENSSIFLGEVIE